MSRADASLLPVDGPAAPPRSNGELVFAEPWESRAFGLAFALYDRGHFDWDDFQQALITAIAEREREDPEHERWSYYGCWLAALERLVTERELVGDAEIARRVEVLEHRAPGHDH